MPSITFNKFDLGIDLRKGASVSDANRLREMKNAHVTTGLATEKRPGLTKVITLPSDTKGLVSARGFLNVFSGQSGAALAPPFARNYVPLNGAEATVSEVLYADVFNGYLYVAVKYSTGAIKHHYLDGAADKQISDANCPHTGVLLKAASKMFAVSADGATVRYSKTDNPKDWTTADDAGFLPTGLNAPGDRTMGALGMYQNKLVALARDAAQIWTVDPDPNAMKLDEIVENVGTNYPDSVATVAGDLYFLSDYGFRSITTLQLVNKMADVDIGSPIDSIVRPVVRSMTKKPKAAYFYGNSKYMCAIGDTVFVYTVSRTAKIAAWSRYTLPFTVDVMAELNGHLYIRSGDDVYRLEEDVYTDNGTLYEVKVELPYMDFQSPGQLKRVYGIDLVMEGECYFSLGFDVRAPEAVTPEIRVVGNTRGGGIVPLETCGTEFSAIFRNCDDKPFRLDSLTIYYENLGYVY